MIRSSWYLPLALTVTIAACTTGGDDDDSTNPTPTPGETPTPGGDTPTPLPTETPKPTPTTPPEESPTPEPTPFESPTPLPGTPWSWCPDSSAYVGDPTWTYRVEVEEDAVLCSTFYEGRTLEEELQYKAMVYVPPGSYPLPTADGTFDLTMPLCLSMDEAGTHPTLAEGGEVESSSSTGSGYTVYYSNIHQPLTAPGGGSWTQQINLTTRDAEGKPPVPVTIDGGYHYPDFDNPNYFYFSLCRGDCDRGDVLSFDSCTFSNVPKQVHHVEFQGGEAHLELRIGESFASTEPAAFTKAYGELDGVEFEQTSYWRLIYNPEHHHFVRHFAVLFDSPINGACGLKVENFDPYEGAEKPAVSTVECDLDPIGTRTVTSASVDRRK